jgi:hypothetical protein
MTALTRRHVIAGAAATVAAAALPAVAVAEVSVDAGHMIGPQATGVLELMSTQQFIDLVAEAKVMSQQALGGRDWRDIEWEFV